MGRLRNRLDRLESKADGVMALAEILLEELTDGVTFKLVVDEKFTISDLFSGKIKELPISIKMEVKE